MRKNDTNRFAAPVLDVAVALALLTRLPLPRLPVAAFAHQARAAWAFPLAGLAIALPAAAIGQAALAIGLPSTLSAGLLVTVLIVLSGAMHEDGLADTADGFWGGFDQNRRLEIMSDSRIGTYGVLALIVSVALRWGSFAAILQAGHWPAVIAVAALSRAPLPVLMTILRPARDGGLSHKVGVPGWPISLLAVCLGVTIALLCVGGVIILPALAATLAIAGLALVARAKIGGQTGDVLGATQQIAEVVLLGGLVAALS